MESGGKVGSDRENRLIDEIVYDTTRCGVYGFDSRAWTGTEGCVKENKKRKSTDGREYQFCVA